MAVTFYVKPVLWALDQGLETQLYSSSLSQRLGHILDTIMPRMSIHWRFRRFWIHCQDFGDEFSVLVSTLLNRAWQQYCVKLAAFCKKVSLCKIPWNLWFPKIAPKFRFWKLANFHKCFCRLCENSKNANAYVQHDLLTYTRCIRTGNHYRLRICSRHSSGGLQGSYTTCSAYGAAGIDRRTDGGIAQCLPTAGHNNNL